MNDSTPQADDPRFASVGAWFETLQERIIAAIEDPEVIEKILRHLSLEEGEHPVGGALPRGPPPSPGLFE